MINMIAAGESGSWGMLIVLGVFFVVMILMTIIPNRKAKKQQDAMMNSLGPGAKIMTVGGFIGTIVSIDQQYIYLNVGTEETPQVVCIVKSAVRQRLDAVAPVTAPVAAAQPEPAKEEVKEETPAIEEPAAPVVAESTEEPAIAEEKSDDAVATVTETAEENKKPKKKIARKK